LRCAAHPIQNCRCTFFSPLGLPPTRTSSLPCSVSSPSTLQKCRSSPPAHHHPNSQCRHASSVPPSPFLSPPSAKEADPLALLPSVEQKSSKKPSSPSLAATRIPVANPARLSKPKQMKVFLLEDLKDFGKKGAFLSLFLSPGCVGLGRRGALSKRWVVGEVPFLVPSRFVNRIGGKRES
jgi:hypothetical protein